MGQIFVVILVGVCYKEEDSYGVIGKF